MRETFNYGNDLIAEKEVNTKVKKPKIMVENDNWIFYKEEYFTTAVKAATWIKKENLRRFNIWFKDDGGRWHIVMWKSDEDITIKQGYAIPKVLTDLVRWKGGEQNE